VTCQWAKSYTVMYHVSAKCSRALICRRNEMVRNKQALAAADEWARINALKAAQAEQQGACVTPEKELQMRL